MTAQLRLQDWLINQKRVLRLMREEFIYLAVVLDAFSRKALGWALDETLEAGLAVAALDRALAERVISPGVVHHSTKAFSTPPKNRSASFSTTAFGSA